MFSGVDFVPQDTCALLENPGRTMLFQNLEFVYIDYFSFWKFFEYVIIFKRNHIKFQPTGIFCWEFV